MLIRIVLLIAYVNILIEYSVLQSGPFFPGKTFKNRSALNSHMKRHEGDYFTLFLNLCERLRQTAFACKVKFLPNVMLFKTFSFYFNF